MEERYPTDQPEDTASADTEQLAEDAEVTEAPASVGEEAVDYAAIIFDWLEMFAVSFAAVILLITLVARHSPVQGSSMINTLHDGDMLIVSDLFYEPKQNDIIVFQSARTGYEEPYVKRIIATGGQTLDIDFESWTVTVDGVELDEYYVNRIAGEYMNGSFMDFPVTVPEGYLFVMGDNRNGSSDSRVQKVGFVDERFIIGRVVFRLFPFEVMGTVE